MVAEPSPDPLLKVLWMCTIMLLTLDSAEVSDGTLAMRLYSILVWLWHTPSQAAGLQEVGKSLGTEPHDN